MRTYGSVVPGVGSLANIPVELSKEARRRLKWFDYYHVHGDNASLTCRYFGISRQTFYRWKQRFDPHWLESLESRSSKPHHVRGRTWSVRLVELVLALRQEHPRAGKYKLVVYLGRLGQAASASMVGRILRYLRQRGLLHEYKRKVTFKRSARSRLYARRKPKEYQAVEPGDLVEVDTLDVRPLPGVILKHLTACDVVSRWNVLGVHAVSNAATAARFLDTLQARLPFPVRAIQVDGGSEFYAQFEQQCERRGIRLYVLPPRSPKLNGHVERAHRTHKEEFYQWVDSDFTLRELTPQLREWEHTYNCIRPHQALGYLTPSEFLDALAKQQKKNQTAAISDRCLVPLPCPNVTLSQSFCERR